jgi:hypothetical protein
LHFSCETNSFNFCLSNGIIFSTLLVYKLKIYGNEYCLCEECFKKTLGKFILVDPSILEKTENIKEENVNGGDAKNVKAEKKEPAAKKQSNKKEGEEK